MGPSEPWMGKKATMPCTRSEHSSNSSPPSSLRIHTDAWNGISVMVAIGTKSGASAANGLSGKLQHKVLGSAQTERLRGQQVLVGLACAVLQRHPAVNETVLRCEAEMRKEELILALVISRCCDSMPVAPDAHLRTFRLHSKGPRGMLCLCRVPLRNSHCLGGLPATMSAKDGASSSACTACTHDSFCLCEP